MQGSNKENTVPGLCPSSVVVPAVHESFDVSLGDELIAALERLQRVRVDRDKTDELLGERALVLDMEMKAILDRGQMQKELEIELDRLYRLNEIKMSSLVMTINMLYH